MIAAAILETVARFCFAAAGIAACVVLHALIQSRRFK